ncbi:MAG: hypothetical protein IPP44_00535 [Ideonella sp.]|nr:hypothetical protein [Ideonella sp.]
MNTLQWLAQQEDGLSAIPAVETKAMMEFSLLWAYFEARLLRSEASGRSIVRLAEHLAADSTTNLEKLNEPLAYWRARYFHQGDFTHNFDALLLRRADNVAVVQAVLNGQDNTPKSVLVCLLTIIYRFRNNLFHGMKWAYGLRGQAGNFERANNVLIAVSEMARSRPREA